jgi:hypothetical protein
MPDGDWRPTSHNTAGACLTSRFPAARGLTTHAAHGNVDEYRFGPSDGRAAPIDHTRGAGPLEGRRRLQLA